MSEAAHAKEVPASVVHETAADGLVEAFYAPSKDFFWGVQWHPERLLTKAEAGWRLIHYFVQAGYHHFMAK